MFVGSYSRGSRLASAGDDLRISQTCLFHVSLSPIIHCDLFGTTYAATLFAPYLNLRHAGTGSTSRSSTGPGTETSTTRLAEHDERKDHGAGESGPSKPEECNRCLCLTTALLTVERTVGDAVVLGVLLVGNQQCDTNILFILKEDVHRCCNRGTPVWRPEQYRW